jgi:hypothetical protein
VHFKAEDAITLAANLECGLEALNAVNKDTVLPSSAVAPLLYDDKVAVLSSLSVVEVRQLKKFISVCCKRTEKSS